MWARLYWGETPQTPLSVIETQVKRPFINLTLRSSSMVVLLAMQVFQVWPSRVFCEVHLFLQQLYRLLTISSNKLDFLFWEIFCSF